MALAAMVVQGALAEAVRAAPAVDDPVAIDTARDTFDYFIGGAQLVAAIGVPVLLLQVRRAARDQRSQRTRAFQERYFARDFRTTASLTIAYLTVAGPADCVRKIKAWETRRDAEDKCLPRTPERSPDAARAAVNDVQQVLGFFEDLGSAYNRRDVVRPVVRESFATPPAQVFTAGWWYMCWRRGGRLVGEEGQDLYEQFERMVKALMAARPNLRSDLQPEQSVRVLCIPAKPGSAVPGEWRRSARLSELLSRSDQSLEECLARLRVLHPAVAPHEYVDESCRFWQLILVPPTIDTSLDYAWQARRDLAGRVAWWLNRGNDATPIEAAIAGLQR